MEQTQNIQDEIFGSDDWLERLGSGEEQPSPSQKTKRSSLEEEVAALKQQLYQQQMQLFWQQLSYFIQQTVANLIASKPYLKAWEEELRSTVAQDVAVFLNQKQQEFAQDPTKASQFSWEEITKTIQDNLARRVSSLEEKLTQMGVNLQPAGVPVGLPGSSASGIIPAGSGETGRENLPGIPIPLGENMELRIVPDDYLDKEIRRKQREEFIRDRLALHRKRLQGMMALASMPQQAQGGNTER